MTFPQRLIDGYNAFLSERLPREQSRYRELAETGQRPEIMVIGCCDSRVAPEAIFDARPGELFVARNVANIAPPYAPDERAHGVSAALEFAVQALKVKHIVVLGHAQCGGIRAFAEQAPPLSPGDFIGHWMALIAPAAEAIGARGDQPFGDYLRRLEQASIVKTLDNLMSFPCISIQVERGKLTLHGAWFGVATGELHVLDRANGEFQRVAADRHAAAFAQPRF